MNEMKFSLYLDGIKKAKTIKDLQSLEKKIFNLLSTTSTFKYTLKHYRLIYLLLYIVKKLPERHRTKRSIDKLRNIINMIIYKKQFKKEENYIIKQILLLNFKKIIPIKAIHPEQEMLFITLRISTFNPNILFLLKYKDIDNLSDYDFQIYFFLIHQNFYFYTNSKTNNYEALNIDKKTKILLYYIFLHKRNTQSLRKSFIIYNELLKYIETIFSEKDINHLLGKIIEKNILKLKECKKSLKNLKKEQNER